MNALEKLLAPYAAATAGTPSTEESLTSDPIYQLLFPQALPVDRARAGQNGVPGVNEGAGLEPLLAKLVNRLPWLDITSGYRSRAEQAALYKQKPGLAAPPGHSFHEVGGALDVNSEDINHLLRWLNKHPKYGNSIYRPMSWEDWHFQLKGDREDYL